MNRAPFISVSYSFNKGNDKKTNHIYRVTLDYCRKTGTDLTYSLILCLQNEIVLFNLLGYNLFTELITAKKDRLTR